MVNWHPVREPYLAPKLEGPGMNSKAMFSSRFLGAKWVRHHETHLRILCFTKLMSFNLPQKNKQKSHSILMIYHNRKKTTNTKHQIPLKRNTWPLEQPQFKKTICSNILDAKKIAPQLFLSQHFEQEDSQPWLPSQGGSTSRRSLNFSMDQTWNFLGSTKISEGRYRAPETNSEFSWWLNPPSWISWKICASQIGSIKNVWNHHPGEFIWIFGYLDEWLHSRQLKVSLPGKNSFLLGSKCNWSNLICKLQITH